MSIIYKNIKDRKMKRASINESYEKFVISKNMFIFLLSHENLLPMTQNFSNAPKINLIICVPKEETTINEYEKYNVSGVG